MTTTLSNLGGIDGYVLKLENRHTGEILRMLRVREANGQVILILEGSLPPHSSGPPLHVHFQEHEQGHVAAGTLGAIVGNTKITVQAGEPADLPAGVPHRWWNAGEDLLEFKAGSFRSLTWTATSRRFLRSSTRAAPAGLRSST